MKILQTSGNISDLLELPAEVILKLSLKDLCGGDPRKPAHPVSSAARLHPRKSFELWKEIVRGRSLPWHKSEIEAAAALRHAVVGIVLRKAEEVAELTMELERSNKELEAFSYTVSHDLRVPFRHVVGYAELLREEAGETLSESGRRFVDTIIEKYVDPEYKFAGISSFLVYLLRRKPER